jgi:hypothetical protein
MNRVKAAILKSMLPHTKEIYQEGGKEVYEVNMDRMIDSLYQSFYHLVKDAYEEGVYNQNVEWERYFIYWLSNLDDNGNEQIDPE